MNITKKVKRITLGILGTAILASGLWACSGDELHNNQTETINKESTEVLMLKLNNYNATYSYLENDNNYVTNGWGDDLLNWAGVAGGDMAGAVAGFQSVQLVAGVVGAATAGTGYAIVSTTGTLVGAVGGSRLAYCGIYGCSGKKTGKSHPENGYGNSVKFDLPEQYDYIENIGILHNDLLQDVYMYNTTNETEIAWLEKNVPNIQDIDYNEVYRASEFREAMNQIEVISENYAKSNFSISYLLNSYESLGYITNNVKNVLLLYNAAIVKANSFKDMENITQYYVNEIIDSSLTEEEKGGLLSGFVVNIQSIYYWGNFSINN